MKTNRITFFGVLLIIWIIFFNAINLMWFKIDHRPSRWDESAQLYMSEYSFQKLQQGHFYGAIKIDRISSTKAGGVPLFSALTYFILGDSTKTTIIFIISLSLLIITISTYMIGKIIYNPLVGLTASILFICYQGVFLWYKYYLPDIPLTAVVSLTILLSILIYKDKFKNSQLSLLLGTTIAMGMAIKHLYVIYTILPLTFLLILSLISKRTKFVDNLKQKKLFFIFIFGGVLIGIMYNLINFNIIKEQLFRNFQHGSSGTSWYIRQNPKDYINTLIDFISFDVTNRMIFPVIFVLGFLYSIFKFNKLKAFLYLWVVGTFVTLLYFIYSTMPYYFLPVLPAISIFSLSWLSFKPKIINSIFNVFKYIFIILLIFFLINNFLIKNLGNNNLIKIIKDLPSVLFTSKRLTINPFVDQPYWINAYVDGNVATLPYPHYWYVDEMLDDSNNFCQKNNNITCTVGSMISEYEWTTAEYMQYKIWQKKLNNQLSLLRVYAPDKNISIEKFLSNYDILITKTGKIAKNDFYGGWGDPTWAFDTQKYEENLIKDNGKLLVKNDFVLINQYNLPDGSTGLVWGKLK